jgi:hypothetical protein
MAKIDYDLVASPYGPIYSLPIKDEGNLRIHFEIDDKRPPPSEETIEEYEFVMEFWKDYGRECMQTCKIHVEDTALHRGLSCCGFSAPHLYAFFYYLLYLYPKHAKPNHSVPTKMMIKQAYIDISTIPGIISEEVFVSTATIFYNLFIGYSMRESKIGTPKFKESVRGGLNSHPDWLKPMTPDIKDGIYLFNFYRENTNNALGIATYHHFLCILSGEYAIVSDSWAGDGHRTQWTRIMTKHGFINLMIYIDTIDVKNDPKRRALYPNATRPNRIEYNKLLNIYFAVPYPADSFSTLKNNYYRVGYLKMDIAAALINESYKYAVQGIRAAKGRQTRKRVGTKNRRKTEKPVIPTKKATRRRKLTRRV